MARLSTVPRLCAVVALSFAVDTAAPEITRADADCPLGQRPQFVGAFVELKALLADWQGEATTCEFLDPNGSRDILQQTTTGLAVWRRSSDTPMFTNGADHWALTTGGLVYWTGTAIDPPEEASPGVANPCVAAANCLPAPPPAVHANAEVIVATLTSTVAAESAPSASSTSIPPYRDDAVWSCFPGNPSCLRDPWWTEWNEQQSDVHVTYVAVGELFKTERRFAEAIDLVWQWPEGKTLLREANRSSVLVIALDYDRPSAFATYSPQRKLIAVNRRLVTAPTWMLADVVAHELSHASDDAHGINQARTYADCIAGESAAYKVERRFLVWLTRTLKPEGLPSVAALESSLVPEHAGLAQDLYAIGFSDDLPDLVRHTYEGTC